MTHTIELIDVQDRTVLARELVAEEAELGHAIHTTLSAESGFVQASGLHPAGPPFVVYRERVGEHRWDVEICAPIAEEWTDRASAASRSGRAISADLGGRAGGLGGATRARRLQRIYRR